MTSEQLLSMEPALVPYSEYKDGGKYQPPALLFEVPGAVSELRQSECQIYLSTWVKIYYDMFSPCCNIGWFAAIERPSYFIQVTLLPQFTKDAVNATWASKIRQAGGGWSWRDYGKVDGMFKEINRILEDAKDFVPVNPTRIMPATNSLTYMSGTAMPVYNPPAPRQRSFPNSFGRAEFERCLESGLTADQIIENLILLKQEEKAKAGVTLPAAQQASPFKSVAEPRRPSPVAEEPVRRRAFALDEDAE